MAKKALILCSSPHKNGNTNTVAQWVSEGIKAAGGQAESIDITSLRYKTSGCIACMGCKQSDKFVCVVNDEAQPILKRIPKADILIFATPLYFFGPTAQMKIFSDRMYSLFKFDKKKGAIIHHLYHMKFAVISTAGSNEFGALTKLFDVLAGFIGVKVETLLIPFVNHPEMLKKSAVMKEKAIMFGRRLVRGRK
ncbi:MAG: flavodoxin family protein [Candidatus Omnitrophota bacterium]